MSKQSARIRKARQEHKSRARDETERKEVRNAILEAAGHVFLQRGYEGFSLRKVAEYIGYSPGSIYSYFDDKDDLLFHVADEGFRLFQETQDEAAQTSDPAERLRALCRAYIDFGVNNPAYYRLMFVERPDLMFKNWEPEARTWLSTLDSYQEVFRTLQTEGIIRQGDLTAMSDAWWATLHGIVVLASSMSFMFDEARIENATDAALTMFFSGFGT